MPVFNGIFNQPVGSSCCRLYAFLRCYAVVTGEYLSPKIIFSKFENIKKCENGSSIITLENLSPWLISEGIEYEKVDGLSTSEIFRLRKSNHQQVIVTGRENKSSPEHSLVLDTLEGNAVHYFDPAPVPLGNFGVMDLKSIDQYRQIIDDVGQKTNAYYETLFVSITELRSNNVSDVSAPC
jgi:hypothetical protein